MSELPIHWAELEAVYARTVGSGVRTLAVTAPEGGEGVTTLARALAERAAAVGIQTLYIDFNLNRPMIPGGSGLESEDTDQTLILPTGSAGLDVVPAPTRAANLLTLRDPARLRTALAGELAGYDLIVFDTSPVNAANRGNIPAEAVAAACDATLLVVLSGRTRTAAAQAAAERLRTAGARLTGIVMNDRFAPTLADELCREAARLGRWLPGLSGRLQRWLRRRPFLAMRP